MGENERDNDDDDDDGKDDDEQAREKVKEFGCRRILLFDDADEDDVGDVNNGVADDEDGDEDEDADDATGEE